MTQLEREILEIINEATESQYIGRLRVMVDDDGYQLFLYLDRELTPTVFGYQGTEREFKDFIYNEFKSRKMEKTKYWKVIRVPKNPEIDCEDLNDWDDE